MEGASIDYSPFLFSGACAPSAKSFLRMNTVEIEFYILLNSGIWTLTVSFGFSITLCRVGDPQ